MNKNERLWSDLRVAHHLACEPGQRMVRNHNRPLEPDIRIEEPITPTMKLENSCRACGEDLSRTQIYETDLCVFCDDNELHIDFTSKEWQLAWEREMDASGKWQRGSWERARRYYLENRGESSRKMFQSHEPTPEPIDLDNPPSPDECAAYRYHTKEFFQMPKHLLQIVHTHSEWRQCRERLSGDPGLWDYVFAPEAVHVDLQAAQFNRIREHFLQHGWFRLARNLVDLS